MPIPTLHNGTVRTSKHKVRRKTSHTLLTFFGRCFFFINSSRQISNSIICWQLPLLETKRILMIIQRGICVPSCSSGTGTMSLGPECRESEKDCLIPCLADIYDLLKFIQLKISQRYALEKEQCSSLVPPDAENVQGKPVRCPRQCPFTTWSCD